MGAYGSPGLEQNEVKKTKKPFYKRWWFIALAVVVVLGVIGSIGEDNPKVADDQSAAPVAAGIESPAGEETQPKAEETFKIGEMVETKKVKAIITGMEKPEGNQFNKPTDGNEFVILNLEIENISDGEINISSMLNFDAYVDDTSMNESISAQIAKEGSKTADATIAVGKKAKGTLGYEVPKDWKQIEVHFKPDAWGNTAIKWTIENN